MKYCRDGFYSECLNIIWSLLGSHKKPNINLQKKKNAVFTSEDDLKFIFN
jgi:hypothetical protein